MYCAVCVVGNSRPASSCAGARCRKTLARLVADLDYSLGCGGPREVSRRERGRVVRRYRQAEPAEAVPSFALGELEGQDRSIRETNRLVLFEDRRARGAGLGKDRPFFTLADARTRTG